MADAFERICITREQAHEAASKAYLEAQTLILDGKRVKITCGEDEDTMTLRQLRFIHGPMLGQIAEQVRVEGQRYVQDVWKRHLKNLFIPAKFEMRRDFVVDVKTGQMRPAKRATPYKVQPSLLDLSGKARSDFIDQCLAHAATEWGVEFVFDIDEREAVRYRGGRRPKQAQQQEAVPA